MSLNQSVNQVESITDFSSETEDEVQRYSAVSAAVAGRWTGPFTPSKQRANC